MEGNNEVVSTAILVMLSVIFLIFVAYLSMYCYVQWKTNKQKLPTDYSESWLNLERKPLIPGQFHAEAIQPCEPDEADSLDGEDFYSADEQENTLGRIIFVMRYIKKREELMVRLVQIEGIPVNHQIYSPNSAYVDVQLKYIGEHNAVPSYEDLKCPPRLDICLQQVYYFIISQEQMISHSLEFRINTFDDQFRRYVSGLVEVNLSEEMGEDILTGMEVVFVKDIMQPFSVRKLSPDNISCEELAEDNPSEKSHTSSTESLKWEPESRFLSMSTMSLLRCASQQELSPRLTDDKRSHSIGYLPASEWMVKEIELEETQQAPLEVEKNVRDVAPTPESFYHIVPTTPLYSIDVPSTSHKRIAFKKHAKLKQMASYRRTTPKHKPFKSNDRELNRSLSWPCVKATDTESSEEVSPEHNNTAKNSFDAKTTTLNRGLYNNSKGLFDQ